jgi:hypothetical protein
MLHGFHALLSQGRFEGQEKHSQSNVALRNQFAMTTEPVEKQSPGNIQLQPRAMARRASVVEVLGKFQRHVHNLSLRYTLSRGKKTNATGVGF